MALTRFNERLITLLVLVMAIPGPLAMDQYTPSLPAMVEGLHSSVPLLQMTITVYLLAFAVSQLFSGLLSDRYGRRPVVIWSMPLFLVSTLACVFANNITVLLLGRFGQGLMISGCALTSSALISDVFTGKKLTKVTSLFSTVYSFIPIVAPIIGGYLQDTFGWRANFLFIFIFVGLAYLLFLLKLPETHQPSAINRLHIAQIKQNFLTVLTHKVFMLTVLILFFIWSSIVIFSIVAPFILQNVIGLTAAQYGWAALVVGIGFMLGNMLNNFLLMRLSSMSIIRLGLIFSLIASVILLLLPIAGLINVFSIVAPVFFYMLGAGLSFPNFYAIAISAVPKLVGVSNSLVGSLICFGVVLLTLLVSLLHAHSPFTLGIAFLLLSSGSVIIHKVVGVNDNK